MALISTVLLDDSVRVPGLFEQLHQPEIAVVLSLGGTFRGICHMLQVVALILRKLSHVDARHCRVPTRRVIRAAFPWVVDDQQPAAARVAEAGEIAVPGQHTRVNRANARDDGLIMFCHGQAEDTQQREGVWRRLNEAAGCRTARR
jgi:hypothetical protein